jgi:glutathione synthase/RimK-type ligase-like ATP-grasp enzyme
MLRVALATSERWPALSPEDASLLPKLAAQGMDAQPIVWSDRSIDWSEFDRVVIRSCWDYHLRLNEFLEWVERVPSLWNPAQAVRWNCHKSYLLELEGKGVRIPPTVLIRQGTAEKTDAPLMPGPVIVKPAVSASAYETHLFGSFEDARETVTRLAGDQDVVVQEFVPEVVEKGEWSLLFFSRDFSHAVQKTPKAGDFRVQQELGGSVLPATPSRDLLHAASEALAEVRGDLLYARVDLVETLRGPFLMELELIEPSLYLDSDSLATSRFVDAIARATPPVRSER